MLSVGQHIGKYQICSVIGAGGMGEVFLAKDLHLNRKVALKVLSNSIATDKDRLRRFEQEAKAASALNHPNILTIFEFGTENEIQFLATEFIKGDTLRERLQHNHLSLSETLDVAIQIASALQSAHAAHIVHRDIKPENVMIREDGYVKVLDFGLAKLVEKAVFDADAETFMQVHTLAGMILGTAGYMSPEQALGKPIDERTDFFSLGVVLYEMLTRRQPFIGETINHTIVAILEKEPPPLSQYINYYPEEIERIIQKCLAKDLNERYQTAEDLIDDLKVLKQEVNFEPKTKRKISAKIQTQAKTEILDAETAKTINIETDSINELSTHKNPLIRLTGKVKQVFSVYGLLLLSLTFIVIGLFAYTILPSVWHKPPKSEAIKLFNSGTESLREGTYYKASKMFEDAIKIDNDFSNAHAGLAEAWMELDYFGRAQNEMLKVYELRRKRQTFLSLFSQDKDSLYIDAVNATVVRDLPEAVRIYEILVQNNPNEPHVYLDLGRAYEKNEAIEKAIECYEKAIQLNNQYGAAFLRLGALKSRKGEYEMALSAFDRAESIYDRFSNDEGIAEVKLHRGISFNSQDQIKLALNQFEQVTSIPRANKYQKIRALLQISSLLCSEGKTDSSERYASDAVKLAKDERMENLTTNGLIDLGNAFFARTEYAKAEQLFQQALEFARNDDGHRNEARALLALGSLSVEQHKADEALQYISQSLPFYQQGGYNKEVSQAYILHGFASEIKNDYSAAVQSFEKAAQSKEITQRALALTGLGTVLTNQEQYPKALGYFEQSNKLYELVGNDYYLVHSLYNVADILLRLGLIEEAKQTLDRAEKIFADNKITQPQLRVKFSLLKAHLALREGNFVEAHKITKQIPVIEEPEIVSEKYIVMGLAQTLSKSSGIDSVQNCTKGLETALQTNDLRVIHTAKLAIAEAFLKVRDNKEALAKALEAKDFFTSARQKESAWRAWLIAAGASNQKGDYEVSRQYAFSALEILSTLKDEWGEEYFNSYSSRADIKLYLDQMEVLK
jgi:serine/threonine protein kinase/Flp pilus assembly protein TadD